MTAPLSRRRPKGAIVVLGVMLALVLAACGGGRLSLTDYAETLEIAVADMNGDVDAASVRIETGEATPAEIQAAFELRGAARQGFLDVLNGLEPPEIAEEMHAASNRIVSDLRDAELALAAKAGGTAPGDAHLVWQSAEFQSLEGIDRDAIEFCEVAQESFDSTEDREGFSDSSWMPPALKEVVDVAFRCDAEQRTNN